MFTCSLCIGFFSTLFLFIQDDMQKIKNKILSNCHSDVKKLLRSGDWELATGWLWNEKKNASVTLVAEMVNIPDFQ